MPQVQDEDDELLTDEQVAPLLGLKEPNTLHVWRRLRRFPELPYIKIGRLVRYRRGDVMAFRRGRTIGGAK